MALSTVFFLTVNPAQGFIVDDCLETLKGFWESRCEAFVASIEQKDEFSSKHLHAVFIMKEPKRRDNVKRAIRVIIEKYYAKFTLDLKVALTPGCYFYTLKDGNIVAEKDQHRIISMIDSEHDASLEVVIENKKFKETRIKYAYDNKDTWMPIFQNMAISGLNYTYESWKRALFELGGRLPVSGFLLREYYKGYSRVFEDGYEEDYYANQVRSYESKGSKRTLSSTTLCEDSQNEAKKFRSSSDIECSSDSDSECD